MFGMYWWRRSIDVEDSTMIGRTFLERSMSTRRGLYLVLLSACFACGGESDDDGDLAICSGFQACGGDLVGQWDIESICVFARTQQLAPECPQATLTYSEVSASGEVTFDESGGYAPEELLEASARVSMPSACTAQGSCDAFARAVEADAAMDGAELSVTCVTSGDTCHCEIEMRCRRQVPGSYEVSGNILFIDSHEAQEYCVTGDTLRVQDEDWVVEYRRR
jgi:hypothetical protein